MTDANNAQPIVDESGLASFTSEWLPVAAAGFRLASLTLDWTAVAATAGAFTFEGSDDPAQGAAATLTVDNYHGSDYGTVDANAGTSVVILSNCPGWIRVVYTRSAGGGAAQFNGYLTVTE